MEQTVPLYQIVVMIALSKSLSAIDVIFWQIQININTDTHTHPTLATKLSDISSTESHIHYTLLIFPEYLFEGYRPFYTILILFLQVM